MKSLKLVSALFLCGVTLVMVLSVFSCKKDKETALPNIEFLSPSDYQSFIIPDSIHVVANITCDDEITAIDVKLVDENFVPVGHTMSFLPNVKAYKLDVFYYIYESQLPSGKYYVEISAHSSNNSKYKQKEIQITGIPRKLKSLLIFTRNNVNTTALYMADSLMQMTLKGLLPCDYGQSYLSSSNNSISLAGKGIGLLSYYDLVSNTTLWTQSNPSTYSLPFYVHLSPVSKDILLAGCSDGLIREFDTDGTYRVFSDFTASKYPLRICKFKNYIAANVLTKSNFDSYLKILYYPSGSVYQEKQITFRVADMYALDDDRIILFGNTGSIGSINTYRISTNTISSSHSFPAEKIVNVVNIDSLNYLISTTNNIFWYDAETNTMSSFLNNISSVKIRYEDLSNQIFVGQTHQISVYSFPGGVLKNTYSVSDSLVDCQFLYTR